MSFGEGQPICGFLCGVFPCPDTDNLQSLT